MRRKLLVVGLLVGLACDAYAQLGLFPSKDVYQAHGAEEVVAQHETVAILPFEVTLVLKPNKRKKLTQAEFNGLLTEDARAVQELLYDYLLKRFQRKSLSIRVQDIYETNSRLTQAGVSALDLHKYSRKDLAHLLGVDAVIGGKLQTNRPLSDKQNVVPKSVFDALGKQVEGKTDISVYDGASGTLLWKYENTIRRPYTQGVEAVYEKLLAKAGKSLPYFKR